MLVLQAVLSLTSFLHRKIIVFSLRHLKTELNTASNIKNRTNRSNVERALRILIERIPQKYEKGLFLFSGVDFHGEEIFHIIEPLVVSSLSYYRCDNKFHTWIISDLLKDSINKMLVVLVSGTQYIIYSYSENSVRRIDWNDNRLVKKHNKGGQSSVRFQRLADESRVYYTETLRDKIHKILIESPQPVLIDGGREVSKDLYEALSDEKQKIMRSELFTQFDEKTVNQNKETFNNILYKLTVDNTEMVKSMIEEFHKDSDLYFIGIKEIIESKESVRSVLVLNESLKNLKESFDTVIVQMNSPFYAELRSLGGMIGRKYY